MSDYRNESEATERMASQVARPYFFRQPKPKRMWLRRTVGLLVVIGAGVVAWRWPWWWLP